MIQYDHGIILYSKAGRKTTPNQRAGRKAPEDRHAMQEETDSRASKALRYHLQHCSNSLSRPPKSGQVLFRGGGKRGF